MRKRLQRLPAWGALGLGLLLTLMGARTARNQAFSGEILLSEGLAGRHAVRAAVERVPWDAAVSAELPYALPFSLRWDKIGAPRARQAVLYTEADGAEAAYPVPAAKSSGNAGDAILMGAHYPWVYLQEHYTGAALAMLYFRRENTGLTVAPEAAALSEGDWRAVPRLPAFQFSFAADEAGARAELPQRLAWRDGASWGVEDGGVLHSSGAFEPGGGWGLDDGTSIMLEALDTRDPEAPALHVRIETGERSELCVLRANTRGPVHGIHFEAPAVASHALKLRALPDGRAVLAAYAYGRRVDVAVLSQGAWWTPAHSDFAYRFEGAARYAILVDATQTKRWALEYDDGAGRGRLVEGTPRTVNGVRLRLGWEAPPREAPAVLSLLDEAGQTLDTWTLHAGEAPKSFRGWRLAIAPASRNATGTLLLTAQRRPQWAWILPGLGLSGLAVLRLRRRTRTGACATARRHL